MQHYFGLTERPFCRSDFGSGEILAITRPRRAYYFSSVGFVSIEQSNSQAWQEVRMAWETQRISLLKLVIVLLLLAAGAALSKPTPVF
jgi:hypothetical protein